MQHVHFIGIAGTGMASLAGLCRAAGYQVTGSDQQIYPPMSTMLAAEAIPVLDGFSADHLTPRPDLVVIGNVCTKENTEAQAAMQRGIPYRSMPQTIATLLCPDRFPLVIAGTHGKTTSTSLAAWLLHAAGRDPSFLVGGIPRNFGVSYRLGAGRELVLEGDEYDSAFFDKTPKIWHYPAQAALLGPVEFDHADIYADLAAVKHAFAEFLRRLPAHAVLAACAESGTVLELLHHAACRVITYAARPGTTATVQATAVTMGPDGTHFTLQDSDGAALPFHSPLVGWHNLQNTVGVLAMLRAIGVSATALQQGLPTFQGVKRRQEVLAKVHGVTVIDDFAHHPTAIRETLDALKQKYPGRRLIVAFEPRSNTSGRKLFHDAYLTAFAPATHVLLASVHKLDRIPEAERLDPEALARDLCARHIEAHYFAKTPFILEYLMRSIAPGDVIVTMSNGSFDNLGLQLVEKITRKKVTGD
ncbi:MAG: hypothetical protein HY696_04955 [Deltaproteobacteria bacterium]|nr:hypothetical protein [Deltaproteobacteria bacterium]